jgi:hypothetical protein
MPWDFICAGVSYQVLTAIATDERIRRPKPQQPMDAQALKVLQPMSMLRRTSIVLVLCVGDGHM